MTTGWIKIWRQLLDWEWADVPEMMALWVRLLLMANHDTTTWHGVTIEAGQMVTTYAQLAALWCGGSRENVGRCCRDNASRKVCKHSWRPGQKKGSTTINTDHRYMGIRFYFEADREIWMPKFKKQ